MKQLLFGTLTVDLIAAMITVDLPQSNQRHGLERAFLDIGGHALQWKA